MSRLLLKVEKRAKWHPKTNDSPHLLPAPADIVGDFRVSSSKLSVYLVDDIQAERVAIAFACNRGSLKDIYYMLFDPKIVDDLGFERADSDGDLPDSDVVKWHQDITLNTIDELARLINGIWRTPLADRPVEWIDEKTLVEKVRDSIDRGDLIHDKIDARIMEKVGL